MIPVRRVSLNRSVRAVGAPVLGDFILAMQDSTNARGCNGTRGRNKIPEGITNFGIPFHLSPAGSVVSLGRTKHGFPMRTGATVVLPGLGGLGETTEFDLASLGYKRAEKTLPGSVSNVELLKKVSTSPCASGTGFGWSGSSVWVDKGCRGRFRATYSASGGAGDAEANVLKAATAAVLSFAAQIEAGSINPTTPNPNPLVPANSNPANDGLYSKYQDALQALSDARITGQFAWNASHPVSLPDPGSSSGSSSGGTTTSTTTRWNAATGQLEVVDSSGNVVGTVGGPASSGYTGQAGTDIVPIGFATGSNAPIYPDEGGDAFGSPGTDKLVTSPPAAASPATRKDQPKKSSAAVAGIALLLVGGLVLWSRRKKRSAAA